MSLRRELAFASLDDVMPDVDRLLLGYKTVGTWTLGQICNHLATAFNILQDGRLNVDPHPSADTFRIRFFRRDRFPEGLQAPHPALVPEPGVDDHREADDLREAIARFTRAEGPFVAHPMLGFLTKDEWTRFHCLHAAHHLGFAVPR